MSAPLTKTEPILTTSAATSLVTLVVALVVTFGVHLTTEQTGLIVAIAAVLIKTAGALYARSRVTPARRNTKGN